MARKRKCPPVDQSRPKQEEQEEVPSEEVEEEADNDDEKPDLSEEQDSSGEEEEGSSEDENGEDSEDSKREIIRKLLLPFSKDQIIAVLKEAADNNPATLSKILSAVESDPVHRKIFVHGFSWDATNETLNSAFKQYGQIEQCHVVTDKATGHSKGYGFVLFKNLSGARKALKQPQKMVGNRMASCHLAASRSSVSNSGAGADANERRLYVANVGSHVNAEKLRNLFAQFGEIEDGPLGFDKETGKFRGFAIFVYKTVEGMKKALEEPIKMLDGAKLECSKKLAKGNPAQQPPAVAPVAAALPPTNYIQAFQMGLNQGLIGQHVNPQGVLMGQNQFVGFINPVMGAAEALPQPGLSPGFPGGMPQPASRPRPMGLNTGFGSQLGIGGINPGVIGAYGSQPALPGLGAYQNPQLGQSSAPAAAAAGRPHPGVGPALALPPYFGR